MAVRNQHTIAQQDKKTVTDSDGPLPPSGLINTLLIAQISILDELYNSINILSDKIQPICMYNKGQTISNAAEEKANESFVANQINIANERLQSLVYRIANMIDAIQL